MLRMLRSGPVAHDGHLRRCSNRGRYLVVQRTRAEQLLKDCV